MLRRSWVIGLGAVTAFTLLAASRPARADPLMFSAQGYIDSPSDGYAYHTGGGSPPYRATVDGSTSGQGGVITGGNYQYAHNVRVYKTFDVGGVNRNSTVSLPVVTTGSMGRWDNLASLSVSATLVANPNYTATLHADISADEGSASYDHTHHFSVVTP